MNLSFGKLCRGNGLVYIEAIISGVSAKTRYRFKAFSERNTELPIEAYDSGQMSSCEHRFVLATPMLDTKSIIVQVEETDGSCRVLSTATRSISRSLTKWLSKINYKLNYEEVSHLRDTDRFTYSNQIHIKPMFCSVASKKRELVIKGIICAPENAGSLELDLLSADGSIVNGFSPKLLTSQKVLYEEVPRVEVSFTARVPDDNKAYCLVAKGEGDVRSGFMSLYNGAKTPAFTDHFMFYYRAVWSWLWPGMVRDHNRKYQFADPKDYIIKNGPKFSIVVPLYNTPVEYFKDMVSSVVGQLYTNWELILVNSTPDNKELASAIESLNDDRIKIVSLSENLGISDNTNAGIVEAKGDYISFFDHDDLLDKLVLFRYASAIKGNSEIDVLYCDEDILTEDNEYSAPHFKSDFNIDLLRAHNYVTHLLTVRTSIAKELMLRKEFDGAQDYDFVLRLSERTNRFVHIPEVLYHWRASATSTASRSDSKPYAQLAGLKALQQHCNRLNLPAKVEESDVRFFYKTSYEVSGDPLVSIIIPNKDSIEVLSRCIDSIEEKTDYRNFEIIIVENNSALESTFEYYRHVQVTYNNVRVVYWPSEFNYSKINNFGADNACGEYLLLLNNDTEVIEGDWLNSMLGFCQRDDVGIVGAKLLYPDDTIQHAGVAMLTCKSLADAGGPVHVFCHLDSEDYGYMNRAAFSQDVSIVTGACMLVKHSVFDSLGGLSERYAVAYNDVDFCLRARKAGYLVVYDADAVLYHYESFSRGSDEVGTKALRFVTEQGKLREDWPVFFTGSDPYHGKFLNLV